jgi:periplasmic protein CpxP/Spy
LGLFYEERKLQMTGQIALHRVGLLRRWFAILAVAATASIGGVAIAQPVGPGAALMGEMGMHQGRLARRLDAVGATAEQKAKIHAIVRQTMVDLADVRAQRQANRKQVHAVLAQPVIDRGQLELLRQQQMQLADFSSQRWMTAIADAAAVLSPEQRAAMGPR